MFCGLFVFQSGICPVLGLPWQLCKSCNLLLPICQFPYGTLCCLGTEFSGSSKRGLCFHCRVRAFALFLETVWKLFSDYFHWEQNEFGKEMMEKVPEQWGNKCSCWGTNVSLVWWSLLFPNLQHTASLAAAVANFSKNTTVKKKVFSDLYLSVNRSERDLNSKSKTLILKDSSVRSIWTYLTASPCYTTNTNRHERERERESLCVCMCVWVWGEGERVCVCVCVCVRVCVHACVHERERERELEADSAADW